MKKWTVKDMPDMSGKQVIVTGANSGLGYEISKALVEKHALVLGATTTAQKRIPDYQ
jgi:NAD(P)-dependent dehydrogenase (short-subunit alcohol dehydrogenase family)